MYLKLFYYFDSVDPFTRKDWYDVKAPSMFTSRQVGKTLVNRTQGTSKFCNFCLNIFLNFNFLQLNLLINILK